MYCLCCRESYWQMVDQAWYYQLSHSWNSYLLQMISAPLQRPSPVSCSAAKNLHFIWWMSRRRHPHELTSRKFECSSWVPPYSKPHSIVHSRLHATCHDFQSGSSRSQRQPSQPNRASLKLRCFQLQSADSKSYSHLLNYWRSWRLGRLQILAAVLH